MDRGGGPAAALGVAAGWDPVRAAVVMSGIGGTDETWEWTGQWQQVATATGSLNVFAAAFDRERGRTFAYEPGAEHEWTGVSWVTRPLPVPL